MKAFFLRFILVLNDSGVEKLRTLALHVKHAYTRKLPYRLFLIRRFVDTPCEYIYKKKMGEKRNMHEAITRAHIVHSEVKFKFSCYESHIFELTENVK